jgi:addiction module RelE/StbE family toxin
MAEVTWSSEAISDLDLITAYIAHFDHDAAERVAQRLVDAGESLNMFPSRGRPHDGDIRALPIVPPYLILYRVMDDEVLILAIRHSRRKGNP